MCCTLNGQRCQTHKNLRKMFQVEGRAPAKIPRREKAWLAEESKGGQDGPRFIREEDEEQMSLERGRDQVMWGPGGLGKSFMRWPPEDVDI